MKNKELKILLSAPRGFCAGVERAIEIVEKSIQKIHKKGFIKLKILMTIIKLERIKLLTADKRPT